jgi:hypothetical protein
MNTTATTTPATPKPRKTPGDFQAEADKFNASLDASMRDLAHAQNEIAKCMADRETLIGQAGEYGCTGKYARALLRKA